MRVSIIIFFGLVFNCGTAQQLNISYRTAIDSGQRMHYLVFTDRSVCKVIFPTMNHGGAMFRQVQDFELIYRQKNDTITFVSKPLDTTNFLAKRLKKGKFIMHEDNKMFDCISGYTYVDKRSISDKYNIFSIEGKIYRLRAPRADGYGLIQKEYKFDKRLRKRVKKLNTDNVEIKNVRGKSAYDKYGLIGMNGVIEIAEKK